VCTCRRRTSSSYGYTGTVKNLTRFFCRVRATDKLSERIFRTLGKDMTGGVAVRKMFSGDDVGGFRRTIDRVVLSIERVEIRHEARNLVCSRRYPSTASSAVISRFPCGYSKEHISLPIVKKTYYKNSICSKHANISWGDSSYGLRADRLAEIRRTLAYVTCEIKRERARESFGKQRLLFRKQIDGPEMSNLRLNNGLPRDTVNVFLSSAFA